MPQVKYALITPARNEEEYIEKTIKAVTSQTILPLKWVIVSDGSTDGTDEIVRRYAALYNFIEFVRIESNENRNFVAKVNAIKIGSEKLKNLVYDFWGNLDADITFKPTYYEEILKKFDQYPRLGLAGGLISSVHNGVRIKNRISLDSVEGAIQFFRRECYEKIGGYLPLKIGGEDAAAEAMVRMYGWEVRSFPEIEVLHHRKTGTGSWNVFQASFYRGVECYLLGYHPIYFIVKSIYRIIDKPYLIGSLLLLCGYWGCVLSRKKPEVPDRLVSYLRQEQLNKLKLLFFNPTRKFRQGHYR